MKSTTTPITCDTCGQAITRQQDAFVEWLEVNQTISDVRIVHNRPTSPTGDCFKHTRHYNRRDLELESVLADPSLKSQLGLL
ncbi:hypothetical protein LJ779_004625 [Vibrio parahaemolyticus]|uniref:hypothetical protein n=1 Tax=Vibrio parahaemolyticus TaxID=670 RepID=UPI00193F7E09|nr:hypothetical protein [Vibrio parahaemolyticus]EIK4811210.1 hypothetical protein [Vibrio parahaemolyticus]MBM4869369.1 hypothetical protein [Vibrio parahaemolyticus]WMN64792.1 hypothetical protein NI388_06280 [Vibrio parahaemolyticus]WMN75430.1 hypothetical protein NI386_14360 [Vibrio parahaemolyticus]